MTPTTRNDIPTEDPGRPSRSAVGRAMKRSLSGPVLLALLMAVPPAGTQDIGGWIARQAARAAAPAESGQQDGGQPGLAQPGGSSPDALPEPSVDGLARPPGPAFRAPRDIVRIPGVEPAAALPHPLPAAAPLPDAVAGPAAAGGAAAGPAAPPSAGAAPIAGPVGPGLARSAPLPVPPPLPAPLPVPPPLPAPEPDRFTPQDAGYVLYQNGQHGTFISFPGSYYRPDPAPGPDQGRRFVSVDGSSGFIVHAVANSQGATAEAVMQADLPAVGLSRIDRAEARDGLYVLSGVRGTDAVYRRAIVAGRDGLIQVFEIRYPAARAAEFGPVVEYMAESFGPGFSLDTGWGEPVQGDSRPLYTPEPGSPERAALLAAARIPIKAQLGKPFRLGVQVMRTDGLWAYVQVRPLAADRKSPFDWAGTPFDAGIRNGSASDIAMVLLRHDGSGWAAVETAIGPTDPAWMTWVGAYGLSETLFQP